MLKLTTLFQAKAAELSVELNAAERKKSNAKRKLTLKKVIANMTMGNHDMMNLFPEVLKLLSYDDIELKKMCYRFLNFYSLAKPDTAKHILPTIISDLKSSDPVLVSLAMNSMVSVPLEEFLSRSVKEIKSLLEENDPALRKIGIYAVGKLYERDAQLCTSKGLINDLKLLIADSNPIVVTSVLSVLNDLSENSKNLQLNFNLNQALFLAEFLPRCDGWQQIAILNSLMNFVPQKHEDAHIIIDKVIPFFQHRNSAVVLNGFKLLLYMLNYVDYIEDYLTRKLATSLTSLLSKPAELQFLILRNVILLILSKPGLIPFDVSLFFCDYDDPIFVKDTKLEIIYLLANETNFDVILSELQQYSAGVDTQMSRKSIRAIGNLAIKIESASKDCVETLLDLISFGVEYLVQEAVIVLKNVLRRYKSFDYIVPKILEHVDKIEDVDSKAALIWIVGDFADKIDNPKQILEDLTSDFKSESMKVQLPSLTAAVKLFLKVPEKGEALVLKLLKISTEQIDNPDVRDRGFFYWRILSIQDKFPGTAKEIVGGDIPLISNENEQLDPLILQELELNMGTLASMYLKPVGEIFRLARRKYLIDSPARSNESSRVSTANSKSTHEDNASSSQASDIVNSTDKYIDDVPALNVMSVKKPSGLSRRLTVTKASLSRKLTGRGSAFSS